MAVTRKPDLSKPAWDLMQDNGRRLISKARRKDGKYPICECKVHLSKRDTHTRRRRIAMASANGHAPNTCGKASLWVIDGTPMCATHSGAEAINRLVIQQYGERID